ERGVALDPSMDDARFNIDVAQALVAARYGKDRVKDADKDPLWIRIATWLPRPVVAWAFLAVDVLFFILLIVVRFLPSGLLRTGLLVVTAFAGVAGAAIGVVFAVNVYYQNSAHSGVVVADEIVIRDAPSDKSREGPKLHAGHHARLLFEEGGWERIRLANGMDGWVPKDAFEKI